MKVHIDKTYGADVDGNRGITVYDYEIDADDYYDIYEQIKEQYEPDKDDYTVTLICPYTENDIEFEVNINEELDEKDIGFIKLFYELGEDCSDYAIQQELIKG